MGLLDTSKALPTTQKAVRRLNPTDYDTAMTYLRNSHEMAKGDKHPWVQKDGDTFTVEINLKSMPLYFNMTATGAKRKVYKPASNWDGTTDPRECLELDFEYDEMQGFPKYPVDSYEAGIKLIDALMSTDDADFKAIVTRGASALKAVLEKELPNISTQAERWYIYTGKVAEFGAFGEKDDGTRISKGKTNAQNAAKQTARRQLGYSRVATAEPTYV